MPWRGPQRPGEFPTLGYAVGHWIEENCVIPDGLHQGEAYLLTDEMWRFLVRFYRLHPDARPKDPKLSAPFVYRGALLMRSQKWGKGPFAAAILLAHAFGPDLFDGWNAAGLPVARPHPTPWEQIIATAEEQTDNTWLALYEMATRGPIADLPGVDIGIEDINLPGGGKIEPRSTSSSARLGGRITRACFDESGLMVESNDGVKTATTMMRNLGGMGGRWIQTTNPYDPSEQSVAQRTHMSKAPGILIDYRPPSRRPDLEDTAGSLELLREVYGDSWWVDIDRILADARDPSVCPTEADAMRFFFNRIEAGISNAVDPTKWDAAARKGSTLQPKDVIALGFDGSRSIDCTSLVASRVSDGRWFHLQTWNPAEFPKNHVPRHMVDQVVKAAFEAYDVRYLFLDPYLWTDYSDVWSSRWPKRVVEFPTNNEVRMDAAIARFLAVFGTTFTHDGDPILAAHAKAAVLAKGRQRKPRPEEDPSVARHYTKIIKKREGVHIDAMVAGILAESARGQAIEEGGLTPALKPLAVWA